MIESVVPMIVCGREKRHSATAGEAVAARAGAAGRRSRPAALLQPLARVEHGADRHEHRAGERARHEAAANCERGRGASSAPAARSAGAAPAAGDGPGAGFTPTAATAYGALRLRYQAGASGTSSTSAKPARSIQPRYSASDGKSIQVSASARSSRLAGRTGPISRRAAARRGARGRPPPRRAAGPASTRSIPADT